MYNYLVEYNAVFALLYVFRNINFLYSECGNWRSVELLEFIEGNFLSLFQTM